MSTLNQSAAAGTEILNGNTIPSDGDAEAAASVNVPLSLTTDDVKRLRTRFAFDELSFCEPGDGQALRGGSGTVAGEHSWAPWALDRRMIHAYDDATIKASFDGGYTWGTEQAGLNSVKGLAAQSDSSAAVYVTAGAAGNLTFTGPGNAWASTGFPGTLPVVPSCIVADPFRASTYWAGGTDNALPKVWQIVTVNGAFPSSFTQYSLTGGVAGAQIVAPGRTFVLASSNDAGTSHLWQITPGGASAVATTPSATYIVDIQWLDSFGWFLLVASNGSTSIEFWTSPTGATGTWTRATTPFDASAFVANPTQVRSSCVVGSLSYGATLPSPFVPGALPCLVVIPITLVTSGTSQMMLVSSDGGLTWSLMTDPMARHQSLTHKFTQKVRVVNNRVVCYSFQAGGNVAHALGLRGGKTL